MAEIPGPYRYLQQNILFMQTDNLYQILTAPALKAVYEDLKKQIQHCKTTKKVKTLNDEIFKVEALGVRLMGVSFIATLEIKPIVHIK